MKLIDKYKRIHDYLRISITDRCNLNCAYCNPKSAKVNFGSKEDILSYNEIVELITIFVKEFEFRKIRLTGGEPFARKNIINLFEMLGRLKKEYNFELTVTTNGVLLREYLPALKYFGLDRINFSLDSLRAVRYAEITGRDELSNVLNNINLASESGFPDSKINTVVIKDFNDDELFDFIEYSGKTGRNVRFIEYMPFSNNCYNRSGFISSDDIIEIISQRYSIIPPANINYSNNAARDLSLSDSNAKISVISAISSNFCESCSRLRITADGKLKLCLFSTNRTEIDLKHLLRSGGGSESVIDTIMNAIQSKGLKHPGIESLVTLQNNNMISIGG